MKVIEAEKLMMIDLGNNNYLVTEEAIRNAPTFEAEPIKKYGGCKYCEDDKMYEAVCYIPCENGDAIDVFLNFCPNCGRRLI